LTASARLLLACAALLALVACADSSSEPIESTRAAAPTSSAAAAARPADPAHGAKLVERFECHRCHEGTGLAAAPPRKQCVGCHQDIAAGRFEAPPDALADWRKNIVHLLAVPSLAQLGAVMREDWLAGYLVAPHDLRPGLEASMPRLAMSPAQARDIAAHLVRGKLVRGKRAAAQPSAAEPSAAPGPEGDARRGRALFEQKGCAGCHDFTGAAIPARKRASALATRLAPDLRWVRDRIEPQMLARWIRDPRSLRPNALMPSTPMSEAEARDIAAFVLHAPLEAIAPAERPKRLPVLKRPVSFEEVSAKVFRKVCWHCHSEPDLARGDGGPGMSGGFGFAGRQLDLSSYEAIAGGYLDDSGELRSLFLPGADGVPPLLAVLLARQKEAHAERLGRQLDNTLRGMPLGLPPMSPEQIQLVESWIAQGRPR
jgi:cytochrome c2